MEDIFNKNFIRKYIGRFLRNKMNISQAELGKKLGVSQVYVGKVLNGEASIKLEGIKDFAFALGISSEEFDNIVLEARKEEFRQSTGQEIDDTQMTPAKKKLLEAIPDDVLINCSGESGFTEKDLEAIVDFIQYKAQEKTKQK